MCVLDLSAAFDTVDHHILLKRLERSFGFGGLVLLWFQSYVTGRKMCVRYDGVNSNTVLVSYGVPQGSVLGSVLFILYNDDVTKIASYHGFQSHVYADYLELYDSTDPRFYGSLVTRLSACISKINDWMASNRLKLNHAKTELIWMGSSRRLQYCLMGPRGKTFDCWCLTSSV